MDLDIPKNVDCPDCDGTGCSAGTSKAKCSECNGQGQVELVEIWDFLHLLLFNLVENVGGMA